MSNATSRAILRIASRGSPLALVQARLARAALAAMHGWNATQLDELCPITAVRTTGDRIQDRPLADAGGKGLFTKEIEEALLAGEADIAVHSMKDVPSVLPAGLEIAAVLARDDPRDACVALYGASLASLPKGARIGTSSVRRQAQVLRVRPDARIVPLRGNVGTRLYKLEADEADAVILATAGMVRLQTMPAYQILDGPDWLPALCQGAIGIEVGENARARELVAAVNHGPTAIAIACERAFLAALDGSCRTPIAGLARIEKDELVFDGETLTPDGRTFWRVARRAPAGADPAAIGRDAAEEIRAHAGNAWPVV